MEKLKKLEEIHSPDTRNIYWVVINLETDKHRKLCLEDIYKMVESIQLHKNVPDDIKSQFNIARNLAIYSWFSYSFHQISDLKAFSTLEYALRKIYRGQKGSFKNLIAKAVSDNLIKDLGFSHINNPSKDNNCQEYSKRLPKLMPKLRNDLAHGSNTLDNTSIMNLRICADFINQLFKRRN